MKDHWNQRYASEEYVYGKQPNEFLRSVLRGLKPGRILFPADGEGRNSVFAASLGWEANAFDQSEQARTKAMKLAGENGVELSYGLGEIPTHELGDGYDCIALIYIHLSPEVRQKFIKQCYEALCPGGIIILEAFDKKQLPLNSGGPKSEELLYSVNELRAEFIEFNIELLEQATVNLDEGGMHSGEAEVVRLIARKES